MREAGDGSKMEADAAVLVAAWVAAREQQDAKNRLQAEELARRKLERKARKVSSRTAWMCEDCGMKHSSFGHLDDHKKRWCGTCAQSHEGAVRVQLQQHKMCEDCGMKHPSFGHLDDHKRRWCGTCGQSHEGAVRLQRRRAPSAAPSAAPSTSTRGRPSVTRGGSPQFSYTH